MPSPGGALAEPARFWEIQIAWSEYKSRKWLPKKLSAEAIRTRHLAQFFDARVSPPGEIAEISGQRPKSAYTFKALVDNAGDLSIACYAKTQIMNRGSI